MFFCTDEGFGIEMVQALDEAHAVDIVQALQSGAVDQAVAAISLEGKDRQLLLWDWMDALEQSMDSEGGPAIPDPLTLGGSEHDHPGGCPPDQLLIVCQQQGLLPRQPVGSSADLPLSIEKQWLCLRAAPGGQTEGDQADRAGRGNGCGGHGGDADRTRPPRPVQRGNLRSACCPRRQREQLPLTQPNGLICRIAARSSNRLRLGHQRKGRSWLSCSTNPFTR